MDIEERSKLRILLVDDENDILDLYANILAPNDDDKAGAASSLGIRKLLPDFEYLPAEAGHAPGIDPDRLGNGR